MPYIEQAQRKWLAEYLQHLGNQTKTAGDLNYVITKLVLAYLGDSPHYVDFNAAVGVLECAKQELYRRMIAPYEDQKCLENGDVYP
jgi:hypothetical protein